MWIEDGAWLGEGSTILKGVRVGYGAVVASAGRRHEGCSTVHGGGRESGESRQTVGHVGDTGSTANGSSPWCGCGRMRWGKAMAQAWSDPLGALGVVGTLARGWY